VPADCARRKMVIEVLQFRFKGKLVANANQLSRKFCVTRISGMSGISGRTECRSNNLPVLNTSTRPNSRRPHQIKITVSAFFPGDALIPRISARHFGYTTLSRSFIFPASGSTRITLPLGRRKRENGNPFAQSVDIFYISTIIEACKQLTCRGVRLTWPAGINWTQRLLSNCRMSPVRRLGMTAF
jgi:hypothetical protein